MTQSQANAVALRERAAEVERLIKGLREWRVYQDCQACDAPLPRGSVVGLCLACQHSLKGRNGRN